MVSMFLWFIVVFIDVINSSTHRLVYFNILIFFTSRLQNTRVQWKTLSYFLLIYIYYSTYLLINFTNTTL